MSIKILGEVNVPKNGYRELHIYADGRVRWLVSEGALIEGHWVKDPVGEWQVKPTLEDDIFLCRCSKCGHKFNLNGGCFVGELQYCPWCGSRMDAPKDCAYCNIGWCNEEWGEEDKRPSDCPIYGGTKDE